MFIRRTIIGLLAATAMFGASAFTGVAVAQDKPYIVLISKGFQHRFWQAVKEGVEQAGKDFDVNATFIGPDGEGAVDRQLDMIATELSKKPAALGIAAIDSQAVVPLLQQAKDQGVIVLAFDSGVASDIPVVSASTNNLASAALAADKMAELIGGEGKVAIVALDQTSQTGIERRDGFVNRIAEQYPNIEIVAIEYSGGDALKATEITKGLLQAHPDLKGIFGVNEGAAIGAGLGKKELGSSVVVVGYDANKQQLDMVRDGTIAGSITQNPVGIGYKTVEAAVKILAGETVEANIDTGFYWYDASNMDEPHIAALLYE